MSEDGCLRDAVFNTFQVVSGTVEDAFPGGKGLMKGLTVAGGYDVSMGDNRVEDVSLPTGDTDAANKYYVDSIFPSRFIDWVSDGPPQNIGENTSPQFVNLILTGGLKIEGSTHNSIKTNLNAIDPDQERYINLANADGTLIPFSEPSTTTILATPEEINLLSGTVPGSVSTGDILSVDINRDITGIRNLTIDGSFTNGPLTFIDNGDITGIRNININGSLTNGDITISGGNLTGVNSISTNTFIFGGTTIDDFEITLSATDATANRTINLADCSGTLVPFSLPSTTPISVSPTHINQLEGITSNVQNQINSKMSSFDLTYESTTQTYKYNDINELVFSENEGFLLEKTHDNKLIVKQLSGPTSSNLTISSDSGTNTLSLFSETLHLSGGTGINTSLSGDIVTYSIDNTVATLTGQQTFTNKTINNSNIILESENTLDVENGILILADNQIDGSKIDNNSIPYDKLNKVTSMKVLGNTGSNISDISEITLSNNNSLNDSGTVIPTQSSIKQYVDSVAAGLDIKDPCLVGTTENIELNNTTTIIDGITLSNGNRILVKDQTNTSENGIYIYNNTGPWNRAEDFNDNVDIRSGSFSLIEEGIINAYSGFVVTIDSINIGVSPIEFSQFSGANNINAGTGLKKMEHFYQLTILL